jgi:hypothetical protein
MADKVHITKTGIQALRWDSEVDQYVEEEIQSGLDVLRCTCHIDADVTLGDIFRAVEQDSDLARFLGHWSWCDVAAFHAEARKPPSEASDLSYIEITKDFEWNERNAQEAIDVLGAGHTDESGHRLDFILVNELVHLPVRLRPRMEINKDGKKLGEAPCNFILLDVLGEIYYEISFYGSPESRDEKRAGVREVARELDAGTAKPILLNRFSWGRWKSPKTAP